jgi:hypothetical protein
MKHRMAMGVVAFGVLAVTVSLAGGSLESGPQPGKKIPGAFHPLNVTGSQAGKKHCLV